MNYNLNLKDIVDRYSEPHRHYHNWNHIQYMLDKFNKIKNREKIKGCIDKEAIYYAILFHDIIYDPKSKTNEEDSANYLKEVFDKLDDQDISAKTIDIARYAIFASKNHLAEPYPVAYQTGIEIFLDLDLAILAEPKLDVYKQYADNIRKEYYFVPDEEYVEARSAFLESLLGKRVFKSGFVENLALQPNIEWELNYLEGKDY